LVLLRAVLHIQNLDIKMGSQTDTPRASGDVPTTAKAGSVFVKIFSIAIGDAEDAGLSQVSEVPVVSLKFDR